MKVQDERHDTPESWLRPVASGIVAGLLGLGVVTAVFDPAGWRNVPAVPADARVASDAPPALTGRQHTPDPAALGWDALEAPVRQVAHWIVRSGDHRNTGFFIIDKLGARLHAFDADGRLVSMTPVLVGYAPGDDSAPGIGDRALDEVRPEERTTPAGRFLSELGRNSLGDTVVWVDHDNGVSMHVVRAHVASERRHERIATPGTDDNRISFGCINVPIAFFDGFVSPVFERTRAFVYVMPDTKRLDEVFPVTQRDG